MQYIKEALKCWVYKFCPDKSTWGVTGSLHYNVLSLSVLHPSDLLRQMLLFPFLALHMPQLIQFMGYHSAVLPVHIMSFLS